MLYLLVTLKVLQFKCDIKIGGNSLGWGSNSLLKGTGKDSDFLSNQLIYLFTAITNFTIGISNDQDGG